MKSKYRLKSNGQFSAIYNKGSFLRYKNLSLVYAKGKSTPRFGYSVSKKFGKAVRRNRAKRQLKECVARLFCRIDKSFNYIIIAKAGLGDNFDEIMQSLTKLFERGGLLDKIDKQ